MNVDPCPSKNVLVVSALVGILEPPPAAYVIHEKYGEIVPSTLDVSEQSLQRGSSCKAEAAPPQVCVGLNDVQVMAVCV
jgi:hypothetical protein